MPGSENPARSWWGFSFSIMAKELPFFKFEPNQWENGNIQMCNRELKGLFIDLCSMYWSRLGDLPLKLAVQKLCDGNATALRSLCDDDIIAVIDGMICIDFLNEQLQEFDDVSKKASESAKARWEKHRKNKALSDRNAIALKSLCDDDAIREEKRREEEKRKEKIPPPPIDHPEIFHHSEIVKFVNETFNKEFIDRNLTRLCRDNINDLITVQGYTKAQIFTAWGNILKDKFHQDKRFNSIRFDYLAKPETVERYLFWKDEKQTAGAPVAKKTHMNSGDDIDWETQTA